MAQSAAMGFTWNSYFAMEVSWDSMVWGVGFQLFRAILRVHVPLSDVTTTSEEGLRSSDMLVAECDSEDIES